MMDMGRLNVIRGKLITLREQYKECCYDMSPASKILDGMPYSQTNSVGSPTEKKATQMVFIRQSIQSLTEEAATILDSIIDNRDAHMIGWSYYIDGKTWQAIANELTSTPDAVRMKFNRSV